MKSMFFILGQLEERASTGSSYVTETTVSSLAEKEGSSDFSSVSKIQGNDIHCPNDVGAEVESELSLELRP